MEENRDELYHYGVVGMKWGIRRATSTLSNPKSSSEKKSKALKNLGTHRTKAVKKISNLQQKNVSLQKTRENQIRTGSEKSAKYREKAARYERKAYNSLFRSQRSRNKAVFKSKKMYAKAHTLESAAKKTEAKISKNEIMQKLFKQGVNQIDQTYVKYGKQYCTG